MSAGNVITFDIAKKKLELGKFNLTSDSLKVALCTSAQALNEGFVGVSGDARYSDLTAETTGAGYTAGGQALSGVSLNYYVAGAAIANPGSGGTNGPATVTGVTGTGTPFQANVTIAGGVITAVNSITVAGNYSALPTNPTAEPVTGGGLTGATLNLKMGTLLTASSEVWTTITAVEKYAVFYDYTAPNKDLLFFLDLETTQANGISATNGSVTVAFPNGILTLD